MVEVQGVDVARFGKFCEGDGRDGPEFRDGFARVECETNLPVFLTTITMPVSLKAVAASSSIAWPSASANSASMYSSLRSGVGSYGVIFGSYDAAAQRTTWLLIYWSMLGARLNAPIPP